MNASIARTADATTASMTAALPEAKGNIYWLSSRIWHGRTVADLTAMGVQLTGQSQGNYIEAILPNGWYVRDSAESIHQKQLVDLDGAIHARLYYQPGSAGGSMEMCLERDRPTAH